MLFCLQHGETVETTADEILVAQWSPHHSEKKCLSPLIIPVSVPVSKGPEEGDRCRSFTPSDVSKRITVLTVLAVCDILCISFTGSLPRRRGVVVCVSYESEHLTKVTTLIV